MSRLLVVQVPAFNEEAELARTLGDIPRVIPGIARVEIVVIDDGSTDRTSLVARRAGADHIVRHIGNRGLAQAFRTGIECALAIGADIVVNTDADNQYPGASIPELIRPILDGDAELAIGDRQPHRLPHFSPLKRLLQRVGSGVVELFAGRPVPDPVSGFRAFSREAALRLNVLSSFSYTIETIIHARYQRMPIAWVPVMANATLRRSRLSASDHAFVMVSLVAAMRTVVMYRPLRAFFLLGAVLVAFGLLPVVRFVAFWAQGSGGGHIQSLVLGAVLSLAGYLSLLVGVIADLIASNRKLLEALLTRARRAQVIGAPHGSCPGIQPR